MTGKVCDGILNLIKKSNGWMDGWWMGGLKVKDCLQQSKISKVISN